MIEYQFIMNNKLNKSIIFISMLIGLLVLGVFSIHAQYAPPPYGEIPPAGQILVDKKIRNPWAQKGAADEYVDNLGPQPEDYHFAPGEKIKFKIIIKNTSNVTFSKVEVKDTLPQYVNYVLGSGDVRRDIRDLTFTHGELKPDEVWQIEFNGKVFPAQEIPNDRAIICVVNKAEAVADSQTDSDTAQLCIEKEKILGAQPLAGANIFSLGLSFLGISALGLFLRKKLIKEFSL